MVENFFEIQSGNFTASEKNKVNNVNLAIKDREQKLIFQIIQKKVVR